MKHASEPAKTLTDGEALAILDKAREAGHLPEGFVERELAAIRGATGKKALAAAHAEGGENHGLSPEASAELLGTLKNRFERNKQLHPEIQFQFQWAAVEKSLRARPDLLWSLNKLEETGGEPDVFMEEGDAFIFIFHAYSREFRATLRVPKA